jgi:hypothetical protein
MIGRRRQAHEAPRAAPHAARIMSSFTINLPVDDLSP